jgi:hypothetical protein
MTDQTEPADAAGALSEIGRQRERVIRRAVRAAFPGWYWWTNGLLAIALTASVESRPRCAAAWTSSPGRRSSGWRPSRRSWSACCWRPGSA